jgi:hypothetical protein
VLRPDAERSFLRGLPADEARKVMGSRARLDAVMKGANPLTVVNARIDPLYHTRLMGEPNDRPSLATLPHRSAWNGNETVQISGSVARVQGHPDYRAAKQGDSRAAARLAMFAMDADFMAANGRAIAAENPVIVPVHAHEGVSVNRISASVAQWLGLNLHLPVESGIVQVNRVGHTRSTGWHRLANQALFAGAVEPGRNYWLVDDFIGQGGTLANLRGYIQSNGGRVSGFTVLAGQERSAILGLRAETLAELRNKHGQLENWWRQRFGFGFDGLTESEARYLIRAENADTIRNRLADG